MTTTEKRTPDKKLKTKPAEKAITAPQEQKGVTMSEQEKRAEEMRTKVMSEGAKSPTGNFEEVKNEIGPILGPDDLTSFVYGKYLGIARIKTENNRYVKPDADGVKRSDIFKFRTEGGTPFALWDVGNLDSKLANVQIGDLVGLKYDKKVELSNGNSAHQFIVTRQSH